MGWITRRIDKATLIAELVAPQVSDTMSLHVLSYRLIGNTLWTVSERRTRAASTPECRIVCYLLEPEEGERYRYKSLDECVHPYYYDCPLEFLGRAEETCPTWRAKVRRYHATQVASHTGSASGNEVHVQA